MKKYLKLILAAQLVILSKTYSQNIAINSIGSLPDTSAMLDVSSTNKGFLAPRMTTAQQNAIPLPAKGLLVFNTTDNAFRVNTGTTTSPVWTLLGSSGGTTTNTLGSSANTLTSTVNGVATTANLVNSVSNSSLNNVLSTSVNGVTASGVPIINSISNTVSTNNLSTSVNGVTGANVQLIGSNNLSLSGTNLTSTVNGVASLAVSLAPLVAAATTNTLSSSTNTLTNTTNGVAATAAIVNSNALSLSGTYLISTINGIASAGIDLSTVAIGNNWSKTGNSGTAPGTNFIGTTDNQDFVVKVNNVEEMRLKTGGNLGINTTTPNSTLEVNGSFALKVVTSNSPNVTLDNTATVYNLTSPANSASITLPAASSCTNRIYIIVNRGSKSKSISSYTDLSGAAVTTMSAGTSIEIISDGSNWLQLR